MFYTVIALRRDKHVAGQARNTDPSNANNKRVPTAATLLL